MKIKLLGAQRYVSPLIGDGVVVENGMVVSVTEEAARALLDEVVMDALNNEHPMWRSVSDDEAEEVDGADDGEEDDPKEQKASPTRAKREKKAAR